MSSVAWYWKRLRRMPPAELPYRVGQAAKMRVDEWLCGKVGCAFPAVAARPSITALDTAALTRVQPGAKKEVVREAERAMQHRFEIFGNEVFYGSRIDWHLDPLSGKRWPNMFWGRLDFRHRTDLGGIKFAWEVNRLHHFPRLGLAHALTGDERYRRELYSQLESWLEDNPYPLGINWSSGIELGIRLVNLTYALKLGALPRGSGEKRLLGRFVGQHARHLQRYPSKYSSCANHGVAEAMGLFVAGLCYPGLRKADRWRRMGQRILEREAERQMLPDGGGFEHSVPYLQFVAEHFLLYRLLCEEHQIACAPVVEERLLAVASLLDALMDANGSIPIIGDEDDGHLLKPWSGEQHDCAFLINSVSVLIGGRGARGWQSPDAKTLLLTGERAIRRFEPAELKSRHPETRRFADAGLAVVRGGEPEWVFVANGGPLGLPPLYGHGHADALSFWLSVGGQPVFVDTGNYLYQNGEPWRTYFRSTEAHNTLTVDGLPQAVPEADFIFGKPYRVHGGDLERRGGEVVWTASHDGYLRLKDPVVHTRSVRLDLQAGKLAIRDEIACRGRHRITSRLHLHPRCGIRQMQEDILISCGERRLRLVNDPVWESTDIRRGSHQPLAGWYAPSFNRLEKTHTVVLEASVDGSATLATEIWLDHTEVTDDQERKEKRADFHRGRVVHV